MSYGSRQEEYGLAPLEDIRDKVDSARSRIVERRKQGIGAAAIDIATASGQVTPGGTILLHGSARPINLGNKGAPNPVGNSERTTFKSPEDV